MSTPSFRPQRRSSSSFSESAGTFTATPGRLIAHLNMGYVKFPYLKHFILDEADRMLDMGFIDDLFKIIKFLPQKRQTLMFSATMAPKIREFAKKLLTNPAEISLSISKPAAGITQSAYLVYDNQKNKLIKHILKQKTYHSVIVFSSTKQMVKILEQELQKDDLKVKSIHSDLEQNQREEVLRLFKNKQIQVLVATDILSRGIDIDDIGLVINYDIPNEPADYVHRVGRTARAESKGEAITFINETKQFLFANIEAMIGYTVNKIDLPENWGNRPAYQPEKADTNFKDKKQRHQKHRN
jgi:superfamily II DNA/RNA helicase